MLLNSGGQGLSHASHSSGGYVDRDLIPIPLNLRMEHLSLMVRGEHQHQQCIIRPPIRMHSRTTVIMLLLYPSGTYLKCIELIWLRAFYMLVPLRLPSSLQDVFRDVVPACAAVFPGHVERVLPSDAHVRDVWRTLYVHAAMAAQAVANIFPAAESTLILHPLRIHDQLMINLSAIQTNGSPEHPIHGSRASIKGQPPQSTQLGGRVITISLGVPQWSPSQQRSKTHPPPCSILVLGG